MQRKLILTTRSDGQLSKSDNTFLRKLDLTTRLDWDDVPVPISIAAVAVLAIPLVLLFPRVRLILATDRGGPTEWQWIIATISIGVGLWLIRGSPVFAWLRLAATYFLVVIAIVSAALWVRSYWYEDRGSVPFLGRSYVDLDSAIGVARVTIYYNPIRKSGYSNIIPAGPTPWLYSRFRPRFDTSTGGTYTVFQFPYWSLGLVSIAAALLIRPKPSWRFGLRDLFTLTTITAVAIGLLTVMLRQ